MELEYKIELSAPCGAAALEDELGFERIEHSVINMQTEYYADAQGDLRKSKLMLRLRRENEKCVCCFKAPGAGRARLEIEHACESIEQGVAALLRSPELPSAARDMLCRPLHAACGASFVRTQQQCRMGQTRFYLCFDLGFVYGERGREALCELELELIDGSSTELEALAERICDMYHGRMSEKSKAQRAFELQ